jgi:hypothetical protein
VTMSDVTLPGATSTIIGARRPAQLEDNVQAIDVKLTREELEQLDLLTKPTLGFPQNMQPMFPSIHNGGTTVNGVYAPPTGFGVQKGDPLY